MPQADGTILIDTEINADGMKAGSKEVEAAVRRMASTVNDLGTKAKTALNKQVDAFSKLNNEFAAQSKKVAELKKKVAEYGKQKIPTAEYKEIQAQIDQASQKMNRLISAQEKFLAMGGSENSKQYKKYQYDIDELANSIRYAEGEMKDLEATGKAFTLGNQTKQAAADMEKLEAAERKLSDMNNRLGTSYSAIKSQVNDYKNGLLKTDAAQKKASASGNRLSKSLKNTGKSANSASFGIGKMLGTSILFSFAFQAINGVLTGIKDGFANLAQYSGTTNNSISMLWSSLERLKNSLATAFAPILDVVAPILSKFIDMLSTAASYVSMFFAFLSGKSTYTRAVAVQKDYAASLQDTATGAKDAAEETEAAAEAAEDYLSPLDDINKYTEQNNGSGSGSGNKGAGSGNNEGATGPLFEEVPIDNKFASILESVLDKLKQIKDIFMSGFWDGLGDYKPLLNELKKDLSSIGKLITNIISDNDVKAAANRFVKAFIYNLGKIVGSFAQIGLAIAVNIVGGIESYLSNNTERIKKKLISLFDVGTEILTLLGTLFSTVAEIFSAVFGSQVAQDLTGNIIGICAEIFMGALELGAKFGRDILNLIVQPLVENKDLIKEALLQTIEPIQTIAAAIEKFLQGVVDKTMEVYDQHIKPFIDSLADGISYIVQVLLETYNKYIAPILDAWAAKFDEVLNGPIKSAIDSFLDLIGKVFDALKLLWEKVLVPLIAWIIKNIIPVLAPIVEWLGNAALDLLGTIAEVADGIFDALGGVIDFIVGVFTGDWEKAFSGLKAIGRGFLDAIDAIFEFITENIFNAFSDFLERVFAYDWEKNFGIFGTIIKAFLGIVKEVWESITDIFTGVIDFILGVFSGDWERAFSGLRSISEGFRNIFNSIFQFIIDNILMPFTDFLGNVFVFDWKENFGIFGSIIEGFLDIVKDVWEGVMGVFSGVITFINGVFSWDWKMAWEGIKQIFSSVWDTFVDVVKAPINWIISMVNSLLDKVETAQNWIAETLSFSIDLPGWAQELTGYSSFGISIPQWSIPNIPYLASGAVIPPNKEFMAVLGDQSHGNNIEAPENLIRRIVREESGRNGGNKYEIPLKVGRRELARLVIDEAKIIRNETGRNPFELA